MSITNYGELKTAVSNWATYAQDNRVPEFIGWAHQEIGRRLRCAINLASMSATINAETIAQPTRFAALKSFYLNTTVRSPLTVVSAEQAHEIIAASASQTYPEVVAVEGSSFRFAPTFTGSATGYALYYQTPATLTADADTNAVLTAYPYLYLYGALEALYRYMEDDNNADRWGNAFGALIEDINTRAAKDASSGPLALRVAPQGVI